jgi:hypothetical protein
LCSIVSLEELEVVWFTQPSFARIQVRCDELFPVPNIFHELCILDMFLYMLGDSILYESEKLRQ